MNYVVGPNHNKLSEASLQQLSSPPLFLSWTPPHYPTLHYTERHAYCPSVVYPSDVLPTQCTTPTKQCRLDGAVMGRAADNSATHPSIGGSMGRGQRRGVVPDMLHGLRFRRRGRASPTLGPGALHPGPYSVHRPQRKEA